jgi:hypothetical protein
MNYGFREAYFEYFESCNFSGENTNKDDGFVYQCRSGLENMNVTTFLMT